MRYALGALALALIFCAGTWTGWQLKSASTEKQAVKQAHADMSELQRTVKDGLAKQQAELHLQQGQSFQLQGDQLQIHIDTDQLAEKIDHATFSPPSRTSLEGSTPVAACPDPFGSAEYQRLYDDAAKAGTGEVPAAAASSGVHQASVPALPGVSAPPSG